MTGAVFVLKDKHAKHGQHVDVAVRYVTLDIRMQLSRAGTGVPCTDTPRLTASHGTRIHAQEINRVKWCVTYIDHTIFNRQVRLHTRGKRVGDPHSIRSRAIPLNTFPAHRYCMRQGVLQILNTIVVVQVMEPC